MSETTGFGAALRQARRARGLSQRAVGDAAGLSHSYVSKLETGEMQPPSCRSVVLLARAVACDPVTLLRLRRPVPAALSGLTAEQWQSLSDWLSAEVF
jgi:transcriptional regulator with XRE-family HTH domain